MDCSHCKVIRGQYVWAINIPLDKSIFAIGDVEVESKLIRLLLEYWLKNNSFLSQ